MPLPKAPSKPATILDITPAMQARATRPAAQPVVLAPAEPAVFEAPQPAPQAPRGAPARARLMMAPIPSTPTEAIEAVPDEPAVAPAPTAAPTSNERTGRSRRSGRTKHAGQAELSERTVVATPDNAETIASTEIHARSTDDTPTNGSRSSRPKRSADSATPTRGAKRRSAEHSMPAKLFVLDTNVLMHDPTALFRFAEHDVYLPMMTLEELDNHKRGMTEVARNARAVSRTLDELIASSGDVDFEQGVQLSVLGNADARGRLLFQTQAMAAMLPSSLPVGKADNQILSVVRALQERHPGRETVLVSKDINMRIKARALGLPAEDYFNDQVLEDTDLLYSGMAVLPANFWDKHGNGVESWQQAGSTYYRVTGPMVQSFVLNEFVSLDGDMPLIAQVRQINGNTAVLQTLRDYAHLKNAVWGITARNREQNFALNLLMNPDIDFVSLLGQAGTGKTLLALAAGLSQTIEGKRFSEIIMTRATVPVGEDIGYLPGTEEEKMQPWMGALEDNLEVLNQGDPAAGEWGRQATNDIIRSRVKVKALSFMRGRTFINKFLIIDEAQNLTPKQMKTLVTRAGPGTKVICLGNIAQIDTPYLTEGSSGLTYVVDRFKGWAHAGHVTLQRGERSRLADFAAEIL